MKYNVFLIFAWIVILSSNVFSQQIDDEFPLGPPYSSFGIGDIQYSNGLRTETMNILGISLYGDNVNNMNPAANTRLSYTTIVVGLRYGFLKSSDNTKSVTSSNGNVNGFNVGIPFSQRYGWVLNLGFNPLSQINYKVKINGSLNGKNYIETYAGDGGLSRINMGMSVKAFENLSLGFEYNYTFGNLKRVSYLDFKDANYTNTYIRKENKVSGSFLKGGLVFDIGKVMNSKSVENLSIGLLYQSRLKLGSEVDGIYNTSTGQDTITSVKGDIEIPQSFGAGISDKIGQLLVSTDVLFEQWDNYKEGGITLNTYKNSFRWGLGFAIVPLKKKDLAFFERIEYRFGVSYENSYFKINDEQVNKYGIGFGMGIPINQFNSFDLGFNYYTRGKTDPGFVKDNYFKITLGLNFGEPWFLTRSED